MKLRSIWAGLGVAALLASACAGTPVAQETDTDTPVATEGDGGESTTDPRSEGDAPELEAAAGFDPESGTITLGALLPLTGPAAGPAIVSGMNAYFESVNAEGGIAGQYQIETLVEDTQFQADLTLNAYQKLKEQVTMFAILLGTPMVSATLPFLQEDGVAAVPISNAASWVKEPNLVPVQGTYEVSLINAIDYAVTDLELGDATWCVMEQDDTFGETFANGFEVAADAHDLNAAETTRHPTNEEDMTAQVSNLQQAGCEVVSYHGTTGPILAATTAAAQLGFEPRWIVPAQGYLFSYSQSAVADYLAENWIVHGYDTPWGDDTVEGQANLLADLSEYEPNQDPEIIVKWGYQNAMATAQVLEKAVELGDLSHQGILEAIEAIDTLEFQGLLPDYEYGASAADRMPPSTSHVLSVDPGVDTGLASLQLDIQSEAAQEFVQENFG